MLIMHHTSPPTPRARYRSALFHSDSSRVATIIADGLAHGIANLYLDVLLPPRSRSASVDIATTSPYAFSHQIAKLSAVAKLTHRM